MPLQQTTRNESCKTHGREAIIYGDKDGIKAKLERSHV